MLVVAAGAVVWTAAAAPPQRLGRPGLRPFPKAGQKQGIPSRQNMVDHLMAMSPDEQREFMRHSPRFQRLPPQQQENVQQRLEEFNHLPPEKREALRERYELFRQSPPEKQDRARGLYREWNRQPPERRQEMREEFRNLREATAAERKRRLESEEFRGRYASKEQELLRGLVELLPE